MCAHSAIMQCSMAAICATWRWITGRWDARRKGKHARGQDDHRHPPLPLPGVPELLVPPSARRCAPGRAVQVQPPGGHQLRHDGTSRPCVLSLCPASCALTLQSIAAACIWMRCSSKVPGGHQLRRDGTSRPSRAHNAALRGGS